MIKTATLFILGLFLCVGCSNVETRSYDITLKNDSTKPVIVWLTKNGPAYEKGWKSPEDYAIEQPGANEPYAFQTVPPGKTASTGKIEGHFAPGVKAILRLYVGQLKFEDIIAISSGSPSRVEYDLSPGVNNLVVTDSGISVKVDPK